MSPPPTLTGTFEASRWTLPPHEAGPRFAQRGLDRARRMHRQEEPLTDGVDSLMEVSRLGEGRLPLEEGRPP